jgi:hypothetical protein
LGRKASTAPESCSAANMSRGPTASMLLSDGRDASGGDPSRRLCA